MYGPLDVYVKMYAIYVYIKMYNIYVLWIFLLRNSRIQIATIIHQKWGPICINMYCSFDLCEKIYNIYVY